MKKLHDNLFDYSKFSTLLLFLLFVIAPLYYHPNAGGIGLRIPNNISSWLVATTLIWWAFYTVLKTKKIVLPQHVSLYIAFPALITFTNLFNTVSEPLDWFFRLTVIWGGVLFFIALFQLKLRRGQVEKILVFIIFSAAVQSVIGGVQVFSLTDSILIPISKTGLPSGYFQQINNFATFQVTAVLISLYLLTRPVILHRGKWPTVIVLLCMGLSSTMLAASASRVGYLSLMLGVILIVFGLRKQLISNTKLSIVTLCVLLIGISIGANINNSAEKLIDKTSALSSGYSTDARLGIYSISLELLKEKPLMGHGIGSFDREWQLKKPQFYAEHPCAALPSQLVTHPHNEIIFWLVEAGLLSLLGILLMLIGIGKSVVMLGLRNGVAYVAILLPIALHTQTELPFYISALHYFLFLFLLFFIANNAVRSEPVRLSNAFTGLTKLSLHMIFIFTTLFLIHSSLANREISNFFLERKVNFEAASKNPFFSGDANWLLNRTYAAALLNQPDSQGAKQQMRTLIPWYTEMISKTPARELFIDLLNLYQATKQTGKAAELEMLYKSIYPLDFDIDCQ